MSVNNSTFISAMLQEIGGINIFADHPSRYFQCSLEEVQALNPDVILLSSEPYPFTEQHVSILQDKGFDPKKIQLINGQMCSWHGVRMSKGLSYLRELRSSWY